MLWNILLKCIHNILFLFCLYSLQKLQFCLLGRIRFHTPYRNAYNTNILCQSTVTLFSWYFIKHLDNSFQLFKWAMFQACVKQHSHMLKSGHPTEPILLYIHNLPISRNIHVTVNVFFIILLFCNHNHFFCRLKLNKLTKLYQENIRYVDRHYWCVWMSLFVLFNGLSWEWYICHLLIFYSFYVSIVANILLFLLQSLFNEEKTRFYIWRFSTNQKVAGNPCTRLHCRCPSRSDW